MKSLAAGVVAFAALGAGLLWVAGRLGVGGIVVVGVAELLVVGVLLHSSTRA